MKLDPNIDMEAFDAWQEDAEAWRSVIAHVAAPHVSGPVTPAGDGSVFVGVGAEAVVKLYPPYWRDHFEFERAALRALGGHLSVSTPTLIAEGEHHRWPYLVMTRLVGTPLTQRWPTLTESQRCSLLERIGALQAEVHALPVEPLRPFAPAWSTFIARQRDGCHARQVSRNLPAHLLADLERFLGDDDLAGDDVILTGEYTPMNLFVDGAELTAMFDFGDGMVGPRDYDFLGPLCFLAAGSRERQRAFLDGYGAELDRTRLMRLLLLHRYSNLPVQIALDDWQQAPDLDAVAELVWP